ncbi:hypothetical protein [Sporichthya polymorpha]|uniref:hypothetical protein n=1 Tax=Sporichthya polymorpha TaxID=35751 RepID=UPI0012EB1105|nr:hypothetical protein [Sporichthya polymorpha]
MGGAISALAQRSSLEPPTGVAAHSPSASAFVAAVALGIAAAALGYPLGVAATRTLTAVLLYFAVLAVGGLLLGAAYYAPGLGAVASASPAGILVTMARSEILAPQFTTELKPLVAYVAAAVWGLVLLSTAAWQIARRVD